MRDPRLPVAPRRRTFIVDKKKGRRGRMYLKKIEFQAQRRAMDGCFLTMAKVA